MAGYFFTELRSEQVVYRPRRFSVVRSRRIWRKRKFDRARSASSVPRHFVTSGLTANEGLCTTRRGCRDGRARRGLPRGLSRNVALNFRPPPSLPGPVSGPYAIRFRQKRTSADRQVERFVFSPRRATHTKTGVGTFYSR